MQAIPRWNSGRMEGVGWRVWGSRPFFFLKFPVFDCQESLSLLDRDGKQRPVGVAVERRTAVGESGVRDPSLTLFFFLEISSNSFKNHTLFSIESDSDARWSSGRMEDLNTLFFSWK